MHLRVQMMQGRETILVFARRGFRCRAFLANLGRQRRWTNGGFSNTTNVMGTVELSEVRKGTVLVST